MTHSLCNAACCGLLPSVCRQSVLCMISVAGLAVQRYIAAFASLLSRCEPGVLQHSLCPSFIHAGTWRVSRFQLASSRCCQHAL